MRELDGLSAAMSFLNTISELQEGFCHQVMGYLVIIDE
jgi:hypothetical protein